jgi:Meiotically Up-regulated Gene 113 (MUG113) protein
MTEVVTANQFLTTAAMLVASAPVEPADLTMASDGPMYVTVEREWLAMLALDVESIEPGLLDECRDYRDQVRRSGLPDSGVYFIQSGNAVKIGTSKTIAARLRALRTMSPLPIELLGVIPGGREEEAQLHREWSSQRLHGEWFTATPELLGRIAGMCTSAQLAAAGTP